MIGIYKITNPKGNIYIGQSWKIETRKSNYKNCRPGQPYIFNSIKKYGWENHKFEIVHELPIDTSQNILDIYEILYWEFYKNCNIKMLNVKNPGKGGKHSEETKIKVGTKNRGKIRSVEFKKRVSDQMKGNSYSLGYKNTKETNEKKRISLIGRPVSDETKKKIKEAVIKSWKKRKINYGNQ